MYDFSIRELVEMLCFKSVIVELFDATDRLLTVTEMDEILQYEDNPTEVILFARNGSEVVIYKNGIQISTDEENNYVLTSWEPRIRYVISV